MDSGQTKLLGDSGLHPALCSRALQAPPGRGIIGLRRCRGLRLSGGCLAGSEASTRVPSIAAGSLTTRRDMPFQLLDLPRNFTKILSETARKGFGESPSYWCSLGEGVTTRALAMNSSLWHVFEEPWIVEPRKSRWRPGSRRGREEPVAQANASACAASAAGAARAPGR